MSDISARRRRTAERFPIARGSVETGDFHGDNRREYLCFLNHGIDYLSTPAATALAFYVCEHGEDQISNIYMEYYASYAFLSDCMRIQVKSTL